MKNKTGYCDQKPNAVVIKACEIPAAKIRVSTDDSVKPVNAVIMPTTVPRRPIRTDSSNVPSIVTFSLDCI